MYNNYTPLQQRQLALQEYSNTQSTYLLVCAPARSTALKATLTDQLHRKFRLVDRLDGELTASVDGVLLAAEDVELMSTALMYFAKALQDGADYAVCNAVFGFGGATALYQSQPLQAQNRCAVVSRTLLERCRAAAHDPENVPELLALAAQLCTKPTLIPQALLHYERGICAEDAFSAHGKRAFIMSHVLDMTGAPIVLVSAVPVLRSMGYLCWAPVTVAPCISSWMPGPRSSPGRPAAMSPMPGAWPSVPTSSSPTRWSWPGLSVP